MDDEFLLSGIVASQYPFLDLDAEVIERLLISAQHIVQRLEYARKAASALSLLKERTLSEKVVRSTTTSVQATAAARYAPPYDGVDLSGVPITVFVEMVTYLPLPDIKTLGKHPEALEKIILSRKSAKLDTRWKFYHTNLAKLNEQWAKLFSDEIQNYGSSVDQNLETLSSWNSLLENFGYASMAQKESIYAKVVQAKGKVWGVDHPTTLDSIVSLAVIYGQQNRRDEAEKLLKMALSGYVKIFGKNDPKTQEVLHMLGRIRIASNTERT